MGTACPHRHRALLPTILAATAAFGLPRTIHAENVTIYRCTDAQGRLSLRDTPCAPGEQQRVQTMQRPVDPPPAPRPPPPSVAPSPAAPPVVQTVVLQPPRPMYECVTPDGETYTSESAEGNPRWVPLWTLGYPVAVPYGRPGGSFRAHVGIGSGHASGELSLGRPLPPGHPPPVVPVTAYPTGTWVRDACHPLPQAEVCARLRDRRHALDRRYNSALQSERNEITREQRGIDARLGNDCRNY